MAGSSQHPEWSEAAAGRIAHHRSVYRRSLVEDAEHQRELSVQQGSSGEPSLPPQPRTPTRPPRHPRDDAVADKWKDSQGLRQTWLPTYQHEELQSVRIGYSLAASFAPQRHMRYVLGRPVLAPTISIPCRIVVAIV